MGDGWGSNGGARAYESLKRLLPRVSPPRLLLVVQNETPLLDAANAATMAQVRTAGHGWTRLVSAEPDLAARIWRAKAEAARLPASIVDRLAQAIETQRVSLDIGALQHLAFSGRVEAGAEVSQFIDIAEEDAQDFARRVAEDDAAAGDLLAAFALATDAAAGLRDETLAFIIDGAAGVAPGRPYACSDDRAKAIKPWTDSYDLTPDHTQASKASRPGSA